MHRKIRRYGPVYLYSHCSVHPTHTHNTSDNALTTGLRHYQLVSEIKIKKHFNKPTRIFTNPNHMGNNYKCINQN